MLPLVAGIVSNLINNGMHKVADQVMEQGVEEVAQTTDDIASSALDRIEIQWQLREMQKQISQPPAVS